MSGTLSILYSNHSGEGASLASFINENIRVGTLSKVMIFQGVRA